MARPLDVITQHAKRDYPLPKEHPTLAYDRLQFPTLLSHLQRGGAQLRATLVSTLGLLSTPAGVAAALGDAPALPIVLSLLVVPPAGSEGCAPGEAALAVRCLGALCAAAGGVRGGALAAAAAPALRAAAGAADDAPLRLEAYRALAGACGGGGGGGGALAEAGLAAFLVERLRAELPGAAAELGTGGAGGGALAAAEAAAVALRAVVCSPGGRACAAAGAGALVAAGAASPLLAALALPDTVPDALLFAAAACLGVLAADGAPSGGRDALLAADAPAAVPLLLRLCSHRGRRGGGAFSAAGAAAAALGGLCGSDEAKRRALRAAADADGAAPLPDALRAAEGLAPLLRLAEAAAAAGDTPAAGAAAAAVQAISVHPRGREALRAAGGASVLEKYREGVLGAAGKRARDAVLWDP
jgi:hypothetical protein